MDRGLLTFFDVTKCGFYRIRRAGTNESAVDGSLEDTISSVTEWLKPKDFIETIPWDVEASKTRAKFYCKSSYKDEETGDALFVFWKQHSETDGRLNGIVANAKFGDSSSDSVKVDNQVDGQEVVYGQPLYYWFIPEHNLIASIKFSNSLADTESICQYIKQCMDYRIETPNKKVSEREAFNPISQEYVNYRSTRYESEDGKYQMTFKLSAEVQKASINNIDASKLSQRITHIVVRDTISAHVPDDRDGLLKLWDKVSMNKPEVFQRKHVEVVSEVILNEAELQDIINTHGEFFDPESNRWNNIGFKTLGNDSTKWFNEYVDRKYIHMDSNNFKSYYTANAVYREINAKRDDLLQLAIAVKSAAAQTEEQANAEKAAESTNPTVELAEVVGA